MKTKKSPIELILAYYPLIIMLIAALAPVYRKYHEIKQSFNETVDSSAEVVKPTENEGTA